MSPDTPMDGLQHLRTILADGLQAVAALHRAGTSGERVAGALTALNDRLIRSAYQLTVEAARKEIRPELLDEVALVAVGGYGRGELSPFSDIDLLFLTAREADSAVKMFVSRLVRALWDAGLQLSQSVRTPQACIAAARGDLLLWTALIEARLIEGNDVLFADLQKRVRGMVGTSSARRVLEELRAGRLQEYQDYYTPTVYLLEPNVKKSPGALRDIHLLRWIGMARHRTSDLAALAAEGKLSEADARTLTEVREFLLQIRNELHFRAGSAQDVLTLDEQVRLAEWRGFTDEGGLLGVERFMQHYYRRTNEVHEIVERFYERSLPRSRVGRVLRQLLVKRIERDYVTDGQGIWIAPDAWPQVLADGKSLLRLFELARDYSLRPAESVMTQVREAAAGCMVTPEARQFFLHTLANPFGLGQLLRNLHRVGLLSRLLPSFEHARCLIQFNQYHKFTIDEHSLRALEAATSRLDDPGPLGQAYREVRRKDILHLAILLHDLGKGYGEDHCEVGRRLAIEAAEQFELKPHERDVLVFLVHQHLLMAQTAFRRDSADPTTLVQFARAVATPEVLRMLYVLTAADTEAVAPGNWTNWKESLLNELYVRAAEELTGSAPGGEEAGRDAAVRQDIQSQLAGQFPATWLQAQLEAMPASYLLTTPSARVAAHLGVLERLDLPGRAAELRLERPLAHVEAEYVPQTGLSIYTVFTLDSLTPGIFSKMAGVLAAAGFEIISAQIVTRADGVVLDTFSGLDLDYAGEPPPSRRSEIARRIEDVLLGRRAVESLFRSRLAPASPIAAAPAKVEIDNESSERFTIIEVFAADRQGLLYVITRTLFELGLSVHSAKISTHLDQVVDAFYVSTGVGLKVTAEVDIAAIRKELLDCINEPAGQGGGGWGKAAGQAVPAA